MALNYVALFSDLGKFIKATDQVRHTATGEDAAKPNLPQLLDEINNILNTNNTDHTVDGINTMFSGIQDTMSGQAELISDKCTERLLDRDTVLTTLNVGDSASIDRVLQELVRDMLVSNEHVQQSNLSVVQISVDTINVGNGQLLTTTKLDGFNAPTQSSQPLLWYVNVESELGVPEESVVATCTVDADGGTEEGEEVFLIEGQPGLDGTFGWRSEGSGESIQITTDNAVAIVANRNFELWNDDGTPASWEVKAGVVGTDYASDFDSSNVFRGNAALKIMGTILFEQQLFNSQVDPNRMYRFGLAYKTNNAVGTFTFELYSPSNPTLFDPNDKIQIVLGAPTTAPYQLTTATLMMPPNLPDDIVVRVTSGGVSGELWMDSLSFAPVTYLAGIGYSILASSAAFSVGDRINITTQNTEGIFQRFFRRKYGVQLPSSPSPSISDSLAQ